jgi:hypothetical protein
VVRYRYTPEALAEAAAAARSVTEVMRLLGVRISGGSHAHISRQLKRFGVDTSHFTGSAHNRGRPGRPRPAQEVLVRLPPDARRVPGARLRRALTFIGLAEECEICGIGPVWQGQPLTLHVDHVNGDFLDNRPPNLRFLCPNCHSQTNTYAGRKQPETLAGRREEGQAIVDSGPMTETAIVALLSQVRSGDLTAVEAARRIGCTRDQVRILNRRLAATGTIRAHPRNHERPIRDRYRDDVIRLALAHPEFGATRIARVLREGATDGPDTARGRSRITQTGGSGGIRQTR